MASNRVHKFLGSVTLIALATAMLSVPVSATTPSFMLNNEKIRFGGGGHLSSSYTFTDSFANSGMPEQPFYKLANGTWRKLTYADIPLSMTLGSGTSGGNWSGAQVPTSGNFDDSMGLNSLSSFAISLNDVITRSPTQSVNYGYGKVTVSGSVVLNGANLNVRHVYELGQNDSFVKATTTITNNEASTVNNVMIWIGTRDDWVGNSDSTLKERGNIVNGAFSKISNRSDASSAIRISTDSEGILFYSTTPNTKTAIDSCCDFSNSYNLNPTLSPIELTGDGSYAISLPVGNLAASASTSITWFYAAGQIADLAEVVRSVASASAPTAPTVASGNASVTASWTAPTSADPIVGYRIRYSTNNGSSWTTHGSDFDTSSLTRTISSLTNGTHYIFQVAALTGDLNSSPTLGTWSSSSLVTIPGAPSAPTVGTLVAGNGKLTVPFTAPTGNGGFPITDYEYSTNDGSTWTSSGSVTSPIVISGLTNGTSYTVRLRAKSSSSGVQSSSASGTPQATAPAAPAVASIETLDAELKVSFTLPSDNGGSSITNYKYSTDGVNYRALSPSQTTSPISITKLSLDGTTSLTNGTSYPITLKAVNSIGDSAASNSISATSGIVTVAVAPVATPSPKPTVTRPPRVVRPSPSPSPLPSPSPALVAVPNVPSALSPESVAKISDQLGVTFTEEGLPKLAPLESIGLVDGSPILVSLFPNQENTGLVVEGDGFTISLSASSENGEAPNLNSDGKLVLTARSSASFSGSGFAPNTNVVIWLFSDPRELGSVLTDSSGSFEGSLPLPSEILAGEHTVQLNGLTPTGETRSVAVGVVVSDYTASAESYLPTVLLGLAFLGVVTFFWILLFRRRDQKE
ncbi:unannotated protein [freshwater metagenome]|uniref:Unannotated protein n=2 Tax=freshwater metagenome TaxID=449393 RepID=A0A6J6JIK4_9ZZZZ|nr:hypothetical protein [Actinomycetota bacterium]